MKKLYIALALAIILVILIFAYIIVLYQRNKISSDHVVEMIRSRKLAHTREVEEKSPPSLYNFTEPRLAFTTSIPNTYSNEDLFRQMQEWRTAGIVYTTDPNDSTILSLQRRLVLPGSYLGHEKDDTSTYNYRVMDKHGFIIELPRTYTQLVDDSIITQIPSMEAKGTFKVDLSSNSYISVPMF